MAEKHVQQTTEDQNTPVEHFVLRRQPMLMAAGRLRLSMCCNNIVYTRK